MASINTIVMIDPHPCMKAEQCVVYLVAMALMSTTTAGAPSEDVSNIARAGAVVV